MTGGGSGDASGDAVGDASGYAAAELRPFVEGLRRLAGRPVPPPSPELAMLLAGERPAVRPGARLFVTRRALVAAAVALLVVSLAAGRHHLPAPARRLVSSVVDNLNPFDNPFASPLDRAWRAVDHGGPARSSAVDGAVPVSRRVPGTRTPGSQRAGAPAGRPVAAAVPSHASASGRQSPGPSRGRRATHPARQAGPVTPASTAPGNPVAAPGTSPPSAAPPPSTSASGRHGHARDGRHHEHHERGGTHRPGGPATHRHTGADLHDRDGPRPA